MKLNKLFVSILFLLLISMNLDSREVIPPGNEKYFLSIVSPYDRNYEGFKLKNISIESDNVMYEYCDNQCFYIVLMNKTSTEVPVAVSKNFKIYIQGSRKSLNINPIVEAIVRNDTKDIYEKVAEVSPYQMVNLRFIYLLIMISFILVILLSLKMTSEYLMRLLNLLSNIPYFIYLPLFFLVLFFAIYLRLKGIYLPLVEEGSAIRLLYAYDSWIYNIFISNDPRHPGLYFALLKPFVLLSNNPEYVARILSAVFSILSVVVMGLIFAEYNRLSSLFAMLLLALHPEYIYRSREITGISLFVLMSLLAIYFLRKLLSSNNKVYGFLFSSFLGLACLSSYAAYINLVAIILYLFIKKRLKEYLRFILLTFVIISPYLFKIVYSLKGEFYSRSMAASFPDIVWGDTSLLQFIERSFSVLFVGEYTIILFILSIPLFFFSFKRLKSEPLFIILFLANFAFGFFSVFIRMMPYYMIFFPISFILLISDIDLKKENYNYGKMYYILFLICTIYCFNDTLNRRHETTYIQSYHLRINPSLFVSKIKELGVKDIVIDIENNKNLLGYYFFENPYKVLIKEGCKQDLNGLFVCEEEGSGRRIVILTKTMEIVKDWEQKAIRKIKTLEIEDFCFVYDKKYPNIALLNYVRELCSCLYFGEKYIVFRCNFFRK